MTPDKRALIKSFVENRGMLEAVKSVLLEGITPQEMERYISLLDRSLPDAEYGQQVKMRAESAKILEDGFAQLTKVANAVQAKNGRTVPRHRGRLFSSHHSLTANAAFLPVDLKVSG